MKGACVGVLSIIILRSVETEYTGKTHVTLDN